jgi:hypothetical protein
MVHDYSFQACRLKIKMNDEATERRKAQLLKIRERNMATLRRRQAMLARKVRLWIISAFQPAILNYNTASIERWCWILIDSGNYTAQNRQELRREGFSQQDSVQLKTRWSSVTS